MADTNTPALGLRKMTRGTDLNTWGDPNLNNNFSIIDQALAQSVTIAVSGGTTTLTNTTYSTSNQAQYATLVFTGSGSNTIQAPATAFWYFVDNQTTGTLTFGTAGGSATVSIPTSNFAIVGTEDGVNYKPFSPNVYNNGQIHNVAPGSMATDVATLANSLSQFVAPTAPLSIGFQQLTNVGGPLSITGALTIAGGLAGVTAGSLLTDGVNLGQVNSLIAASLTASTSPSTVRVDASDTTAGYLYPKLLIDGQAGTVSNTASNEQLNFAIGMGFPYFQLGVI